MTETALAPGTTCPSCGYEIDATTGVNGEIPDPGDVSICWQCGEPSVFIMCPEGITISLPSPEERERILQDETAAKVVAAVKLARSITREPN